MTVLIVMTDYVTDEYFNALRCALSNGFRHRWKRTRVSAVKKKILFITIKTCCPIAYINIASGIFFSE